MSGCRIRRSVADVGLPVSNPGSHHAVSSICAGYWLVVHGVTVTPLG